MRRNTADVFTHRSDHEFDVAGFVGIKPVAVVVFLEVVKKPEEILAESPEFNRDTYNGSESRNAGSANSRGNTGRNSCNTYVVVVWATDS